jgi:hypothetical protein
MDGKRAANLPRKREKTRFATLKNGHYAGETGSPLTASSARESASNRCVFVVSSLAGIALKLPCVSAPANASVPTRDAKRQGVGRERQHGLITAGRDAEKIDDRYSVLERLAKPSVVGRLRSDTDQLGLSHA